MPTIEMMACPHCGAQNSRRKSLCYQCGNRMSTTEVTSKTPRHRFGRRAAVVATNSASSEQMGKQTVEGMRHRKSSVFLGASLRQRAQFYHQMASLLNAGIPLGLALQHSAENCAFQLRPMLTHMSDKISAGGRFSEQLLDYPSIFPDWEVNVVVAAEKSGVLPDAMSNIAQTIEMESNMRSSTFASTFFIMATAVVAVLVLFIVHNVGKVQSGKLMDVFAAVGMAFLYCGLVLLALFAFIVFWRFFGRSRVGSALIATFMPKIPLIGPILQGLGRIRFVRVLGALWKAGVSPIESLEIAAKTTGNYHFIRQIEAGTVKLVKGGASISSVLAPTKFLPGESLYLLQTGETSGNVADSLEKIAEYFAVDVQARVKTLPDKLMLLGYAIIVPIVFYILYHFYTTGAAGTMPTPEDLN